MGVYLHVPGLRGIYVKDRLDCSNVHGGASDRNGVSGIRCLAEEMSGVIWRGEQS